MQKWGVRLNLNLYLLFNNLLHRSGSKLIKIQINTIYKRQIYTFNLGITTALIHISLIQSVSKELTKHYGSVLVTPLTSSNLLQAPPAPANCSRGSSNLL